MKEMAKIVLAVFLLSLVITGSSCRKNIPEVASGESSESISSESSNTTSVTNSQSASSDGTVLKTNSSGTTTSTTVKNQEGETALSWAQIKAKIPASLKGTTIKIYSWNEMNALTSAEKVVNAFTKETGIKVEWTTGSYSNYNQEVAALIAAKKAPDVVRLLGLDPGIITLLQPLSNTGFYFNDKAWDKQVSSFYTINGKQYGANIAHTLVQQPEVFYYNRELIAQYDLEDPYALWKSGKWTWSKFVSLCKDFITESGNESSAYSPHFLEMGSAIRGVGFVGFNGNNYVSNVSNKTLVQGIQSMIKMKEDGILSTNSYDLAGFESGKCLFFSDSIINARITHFNFGSMKTKSILGVVPLPKIDGQSTYYQQFNELEAYGIPAGASNVMAVPYFLRYYLDAANYDKDNFFMDRSALDVYNYCMGQPVRNMFRTGSYIITKDAGIDYYELVIKVFNAKSAQVASILAQNQAVVNASVKQANSKLSKMG